MVFASMTSNARYCLSGAKLPSQPLTETSLHAKGSSLFWEFVWMPLALLPRKFAHEWVKPKVNSTKFGGVRPCTSGKTYVFSKRELCQVVILPAHNVVE